MARVLFPEHIAPSSRSFTPGEYPQAVFEAQNGAKSIIRYGNKSVNAKLTLGFTNISEEDASALITNYNSVNSDWDYVIFGSDRGLQGINSIGFVGLRDQILQGGSSGLRWRYSGPPTVTSVQPGIHNVTCSFVACLDGD
tara:strand:+ start:273 stop:692 length:420 start_codon:yes stop_codon:yes gene_type:complete